MSVAIPVEPAPSLTGNWQIQSAATPASGTNPALGVLLLGSLQSSGSNVNGTFRYSNLSQPASCSLNQVVALSGSVDSNGNLTLASNSPTSVNIKVRIVVPAVPTNFSTGTIEVDGASCGYPSSAAIGVEIAPVTGTFSGPLTSGTLGSPGTAPAGTGTVTLSQSSTPAADGQFPVTGSLAYTFGACTGTIPVSGDASGVGVTLSTAATAPAAAPTVNFFGTTIPTATAITTAELTFVTAPCAGSPAGVLNYTGTLARQ